MTTSIAPFKLDPSRPFEEEIRALEPLDISPYNAAMYRKKRDINSSNKQNSPIYIHGSDDNSSNYNNGIVTRDNKGRMKRNAAIQTLELDAENDDMIMLGTIRVKQARHPKGERLF